MTIAISLDSNTERLARKLADVTGKALPTIVKEAIEAQAKAAGVAVIPVTADHLTRDQRLARLIDIAKGFDALPVIDPRTADEIIGYDDLGVPK